MKAFILASFLGIAYAFSKNIEFIHKRSASDPSQDPSLDLSLDLSLDSIGEEKIMSLILGKKAIDNKCKTELEKYCGSLENSGLVPENVHPALKEFCGNVEQKCIDLKDKINTTSNNIWDSLYNIVTSISNKNFHLEKAHCNYAHVQCMFFQEFSSFSSICDQIAEQCHHQINEDLAYEALLRTLPKNVESQVACEEKIKESCFKLNKESYYLLWSCFQKEYTCENLLIKKNNCKSLKKDIENTFQEFPPTLQEEIGFYRLHDEAAAHGVLIIKPISTGFNRFILLAYHIKNTARNRTKRCIKYLENCAFGYLTEELENLCNTTNHDEVCEKIDREVQEECDSFKLALQKKGLMGKNVKSQFYTLNKLSKIIYEESYTTLISKCAYIQSHCGVDFTDACGILRIAYYRAQFYKLAKEVLEGGLFGLFHNLDSDGTKKCIDKLVEKCKVVRNNSINLLSMCLKPKETCEALAEDVERKSYRLRHALDKTRDYPREKDCLVLEKQCEDLTKDFEELNGPCATLKRNCAHLRNTKEVKDSLLSKNTDILANIDNCTTYLNVKCPRWFRREINPFNLTCVAHHKSCVIMIEEVQNHCLAFKENMESHDVIKKSEDNEKDNICFLWGGYCDMLVENCPDKLKQGNN
ncbi:uncharacterized protein T551_02948, partial [Pneumocystis jirovecii RU7]